jgi:hypothetical protein
MVDLVGFYGEIMVISPRNMRIVMGITLKQTNKATYGKLMKKIA